MDNRRLWDIELSGLHSSRESHSKLRVSFIHFTLLSYRDVTPRYRAKIINLPGKQNVICMYIRRFAMLNIDILKFISFRGLIINESSSRREKRKYSFFRQCHFDFINVILSRRLVHYYTYISNVKLVLTPFSRCSPKYRLYPRLTKISRFFTLLASGVNAAERASRLYDEPPTLQF